MLPIIIFILALFVRVYDLHVFPLNYDEVAWTYYSLNNFNMFFGIPVACFHGHIQPLFSYIVFFANRIFSLPIYILRIPSIFIGVSTVIILYKLAKDMYGRKAGLISALLLCFLPWHIIHSRLGLPFILTPFFGCLIFYFFLKALNKKSNVWFIGSVVLLVIGSFYTYQASVIFIPVFLMAIFFLQRDLAWLRTRTVIWSVLIFVIIILPLIYLQATGDIDNYLSRFYRLYYQDMPFRGDFGNFILKSAVNFRYNISSSFKALFFDKAEMLYGRGLKFPLLGHLGSLLIILISIIISFMRRKPQDRILLIWFILGYICSVAGARFYLPRYSIIILPPALIFIGSFIGGILDNVPEKECFKGRFLFLAGSVLWLGFFAAGLWQTAHYYHTAPFNMEECRNNSYGCKEAAYYLGNIPDIKNYDIVTDYAMDPFYIYFQYYLCNPMVKKEFHGRSRQQIKEQLGNMYYLIWAPESHPSYYQNGKFSRLWKDFINQYPGSIPFRTIYYLNGMEAIHMFKVKKGGNYGL